MTLHFTSSPEAHYGTDTRQLVLVVLAPVKQGSYKMVQLALLVHVKASHEGQQGLGLTNWLQCGETITEDEVRCP